MTLPNFLVIGAAKSGTTALYHYLKQHPEVFLSEVKEPRHFAFERETYNFNDCTASLFREKTIFDFDEYCNLFREVKNEKAIGEMSQLYLSQPNAARRIAQKLPQVKLLAILRHPADRAYSHYLMKRRDGDEFLSDFAVALQAEEKRIRENWSPTWYYKSRGFYYQQLKKYYDLFPSEQIKIFLYDDFIENPRQFFKNICRFLEIDDNFVPDMSRRHNISAIPKSRKIYTLLTMSHPLKSFSEKILTQKIRDRLRNKLHQLNSAKPNPLPTDIRQRLIADYRDDILQLQKLIGRDLSHWLQ